MMEICFDILVYSKRSKTLNRLFCHFYLGRSSNTDWVNVSAEALVQHWWQIGLGQLYIILLHLKLRYDTGLGLKLKLLSLKSGCGLAPCGYLRSYSWFHTSDNHGLTTHICTPNSCPWPSIPLESLDLSHNHLSPTLYHSCSYNFWLHYKRKTPIP